MKAKRPLVIVGIVGLAIGTFLLYPEAKLIMAGDRIMQQFPPGYLGMTMSNKNWLLLLTLILVGGCLGYIIWKLLKKSAGFKKIRE